MRFFAFLLTASLSLSVVPVSAQEDVRPPPSKPSQSRQAPRPITLDSLFERLAKAGSEREADGIASLIERRLSRSGSDTADLLFSRAAKAVEDKDYPLSVELLDRVLALEPQWAEAWYRRATVFYLLDDPVEALADLHKAVTLEPRHFGAWTALGHLFMSSDEKSQALVAYRKVLQINPQTSAVQTIVSHLAPEIDGQDL
ncbi:tetratricopeptide repeat protein [Microvirga puerhi]|uniref:Tetratricopeptide repeat protein n=1 Tax=Microvirga puerhi TaxID=2876078 RepID=A0ABS7VQF2_9HYPH|nr:tetratricopeptide repeat protein [Microvirga puerhi]MBZ6077371.1 tetratricopeptide repeat protein [Microvirga puerhi]